MTSKLGSNVLNFARERQALQRRELPLSKPPFYSLLCDPHRPRFSDGRRRSETGRRDRRSTPSAISSDQGFSHKVSSSMFFVLPLTVTAFLNVSFSGFLFGSVFWETLLPFLKHLFVLFLFLQSNARECFQSAGELFWRDFYGSLNMGCSSWNSVDCLVFDQRKYEGSLVKKDC